MAEEKKDNLPLRVYRGGGWYGYAGYCRSAFRDGIAPDFRLSSLGFRVVAKQNAREDIMETDINWVASVIRTRGEYLAFADALEETGHADQAEVIRIVNRLTSPTECRNRHAEEHRLQELLLTDWYRVPVGVVNSIGMRLVPIPDGTYLMGSPENETGRYNDEHQSIRTVAEPLYIGETTVTLRQWQEVMGRLPEGAEADLDLPVTRVNWHEAMEFCERLTEREGSGLVYSLPGEMEWEYACRGGTQTAYHFGSSADRLGDFAWYADNSEGRVHRPREKRPNPFGLFDMHGNVWEWCADKWSERYGE